MDERAITRYMMQNEINEKKNELQEYTDEVVSILSDQHPLRRFVVQYKIGKQKIKLFGSLSELIWHIREATDFERYLGQNLATFIGRRLGKEVARFSTFKFRVFYDHFYLYDQSLKGSLEEMLEKLEKSRGITIHEEYKQK